MSGQNSLKVKLTPSMRSAGEPLLADFGPGLIPGGVLEGGDAGGGA